MLRDLEFDESNFRCEPCGATEGKGVYAICVGEYPGLKKPLYVVYIGSSFSISKRINNGTHVYRRLFNILKNYIVCCFYYECDDIRNIEKELIKKYKPRFNIQHNG